MKRPTYKNVMGMLMVLTASSSLLLGFWLARPRPLSASSSTELSELVARLRQDKIVTQMTKRYEGMSLNFEGPDPRADRNARWQEIQFFIQKNGAKPDEAERIVRVAQAKLKQEWPCFAEHGYLQGQPVWIVVGSSPRGTGFSGWICPPSAQDIRRERIRKYCADIQVAIVNLQPPHQFLS